MPELTADQQALIDHCKLMGLTTLRNQFPEAGDWLYVTLVVGSFAEALAAQADQTVLADLVNAHLAATPWRLVRRAN